jgi:hypothetical protein
VATIWDWRALLTGGLVFLRLGCFVRLADSPSHCLASPMHFITTLHTLPHHTELALPLANHCERMRDFVLCPPCPCPLTGRFPLAN